MPEYWRRGQRALLAGHAGIHKTTLSDILCRRREVSKHRAIALQEAAKKMGLLIPWVDWLFNYSTTHPAFQGEPREKSKI